MIVSMTKMSLLFSLTLALASGPSKSPILTPKSVISSFRSPILTPKSVISSFRSPILTPKSVISSFRLPILTPKSVISSFRSKFLIALRQLFMTKFEEIDKENQDFLPVG